MNILTKIQADAASRLFQKRPDVIPGTRAIIDKAAQRSWHAEVTAAMQAHDIRSPAHVNAFCDLAGVAD